jgi:pilus assembly protein CpaE
MAQLLSALIVEPDPDGRLDAARAVEAIGFEQCGQAAYGTEATFLAAQERPNVILLALDDPPTRGISTLEALQRLTPDTPVIAYASASNPETMRKAMRSGARDFLEKPLDHEELREAVYTALSHEEQRQMARWSDATIDTARGTVVTVISAKGGVGKTSISTNLAVALKQLSGQEVALVDADAQFGESALSLDLDVDAGVADLVRNEADFSRAAIARYLRRHDSGVDVLSAGMEPADWRPVQPEQITAIVQSLAEGHEYVIVDTPGIMLEVTNAALNAAAVILLITSLQLSSLKNTKTALRMLDSWSIARDRVRLVVNNSTRATGVTVEDVASATAMDVALYIEHDARVARLAQAGVPVILEQPHSEFSRSIDILARGLAGMSTDGARGGRSLLDWLPLVGKRA